MKGDDLNMLAKQWDGQNVPVNKKKTEAKKGANHQHGLQIGSA
jgi:hypothetical protein